LNPEEKATIRYWLGVSRFVYNRTIEMLNYGIIKANWKAIKDACKAVIPILYEDAHNQDPPVVPPWQGGTTGG
jgi:putative transposase